MEKITLSTRWCTMAMNLVLILFFASCTNNSADDSLYETQARKKKAPRYEKPVVEREDITIEPDRSEDWEVLVEKY